MKIFIAYGFDLGSHTLIGASLTQEEIDILTDKYKKDRIGYFPYVIVREVNTNEICFNLLNKEN